MLTDDEATLAAALTELDARTASAQRTAQAWQLVEDVLRRLGASPG